MGKVFAWRPRYERCLGPVCMRLQSSNQRGGTSWAELRLHCKHPPKPPPGLSRAVYPTPSHHCSDSSPSPPHQSPGQSQLPDLNASSSASQQLPNNARPDNRLPSRLQVCQPRACQITVSVNSGGGGGREEEKEKRKGWKWMGKEWREQDGACWVGWDGESVTHSHTYAHTHTYTRLWHIYHSRPIFFWCWHPLTPINVSLPSLFPIFLSGNSLGHISPTHLSVLFLPPFLPLPHRHTCSISIPQSQSTSSTSLWFKKKREKKKKKKKTKKEEVMGRKMKWLSGPSRKSVARSSRQAIFPQLLPLTEPSLPVDEVLIPGLQ